MDHIFFYPKIFFGPEKRLFPDNLSQKFYLKNILGKIRFSVQKCWSQQNNGPQKMLMKCLFGTNFDKTKFVQNNRPIYFFPKMMLVKKDLVRKKFVSQNFLKKKLWFQKNCCEQKIGPKIMLVQKKFVPHKFFIQMKFC